ncbi:MAG: EamA family transporter [Anaerolineae bacterium]|nr:EamA family transporter [Anaerolineae bacterium]
MSLSLTERAAALGGGLTGDRRRLVGVIMGLSYGAGWAACTVWLRRLLDTYPLHPTGIMFWRGLIVSGALMAILLVRGQRAQRENRRRRHGGGRPPGQARVLPLEEDGRTQGGRTQGSPLRVARRHVPLLVLFGFVGIALNNASWGLSVNLNGVTVATVMAYSAPIFTVLLSRPLYGEHITRRKATSLLLALTGCLLVSQVYNIGRTQLQTMGMAMALAVGLTQAGRDLLGKKVGGLYPELKGLFYGFLFGTVFLGVGQLSWELVPRLPPLGWLELGGMSLGIMASYLLYLGALARLPVSVASILGLSEAVVAAVLAYLVHGETLSGPQILGALLVISGVVVLEVRDA